MNIITNMSRDILNTFKKQSYDENYTYRNILYTKIMEVDNGFLLFNLFTSEMILLSNDEYNQLITNQLKETNFFLYHFLIAHWFLIPDEYNEKTLIYLYRNMNKKKHLISNKINSYVILTTTDCNARCYYCFEMGAKRVKMTSETAINIADYIIKKSDHNKTIHISWFGGEPLFNSEVIDIITSHLKEHNLKYDSSMISNGYLFDNDMIHKAKTEWNLSRIQITLDGTRDIYNKTKAYIYKDDVDPFEKVLNNIGLLADQKIHVSIRCNVSLDNFSNFYQLIDLIDKRYDSDRKKCIWMYFNQLFEMNGMEKRTFDEELRLNDELYNLVKYTISKKLYSKEKIALNRFNSIKLSYCMADSPDSVLISPNGDIGSCEHFVDSDFHGSIYDKNTFDRDYASLREWKKKRKENIECKACKYYPKCYINKRCEVAVYKYPFCYNKIDRQIEIAMINTYNFYLRKKEMKK